MTPEDQEARSLKFEPTGSVNLRQLSTGNFAMYHIGGISTPFWIGPENEIAVAYFSRPPPPKTFLRPVHEVSLKGIDLASLDIDI